VYGSSLVANRKKALSRGSTLTALEEAEIIPGKDSDTRIKPLALTNGHGRYITVTPERALASIGECPLHAKALNFWPFHFRNRRVTAVSLLQPPCGGFGSEAVTWIQKPEAVYHKKMRWDF
jgi:hypothetical protein